MPTRPDEYTPLTVGEQGAFQDEGRGDVPYGYAWDAIDLIPEFAGAPWRERGGWTNQHSDQMTNAPDGIVFAPFVGNPQIVVSEGTKLAKVSPVPGSTKTELVAGIVQQFQNPIFYHDQVILPGNGAAANGVQYGGGAGMLAIDATAPAAKYACIYKDRLVLANSVANPLLVSFSHPAIFTFDAISVFSMPLPVTGLAAMRNQVLTFHDSSISRIIGTTPPDSALSDPTGDMRQDVMFDKAGCTDAHSIASWYDQVIFADPRGVHITDGATVKNMMDQGGMGTPWRRDANAVSSIAGAVFRNQYIVTLRGGAGTPVTYVVDIPSRRVYRFSNLDCSCYAAYAAVGSQAETLYAGHVSTKRVINVGTVFAPDNSVEQKDANNNGPTASLEFGFIRFGHINLRYRKITRPGWRRLFDLHLFYNCDHISGAGTDSIAFSYLHSPTDTSYEAIGNFKSAVEYVHNKLPWRRRLQGAVIKLTALSAGGRRDLRIHEMGVTMYEEDQRRIR